MSKYETWGDFYNACLRRGFDHGWCTWRADLWLERRQKRNAREGGQVRLARPPAPDGNGTTVGTQSAAPHLLEALQKIAAGDGVYGAQAHEYKQIARAAIAKIARTQAPRECAKCGREIADHGFCPDCGICSDSVPDAAAG